MTPSAELEFPPLDEPRPARPLRVSGGWLVALLVAAALMFVLPGAADSRVQAGRLGPLTTSLSQERANVEAATARLAALQAQVAQARREQEALQSRLDRGNDRLEAQEARLLRINAARSDADLAAIAAAARASAETSGSGGP